MRIASLVPSSTEMLFALGLGESVVGVTHECDWPAAARELPHLTATVLPEGLSAGEIDAAVKQVVGEGRALYSLDEARLAELAPDLIVTQAVCDVCAVSYEDVVEVAARLPGPPRVLQQDPSSLAEVLEDVTRLGDAAGIGERAAALRGELEARLDAVRAAVAGAPAPAGGRPRVARPALRRRPLAAGDGRDRRRRGRRRDGRREVARGRVGGAGGARPRPRRGRCPAGGTLEDSLAQATEHRERIGRSARSASSPSTPPRPTPAPARAWSTAPSCSPTCSTRSGSSPPGSGSPSPPVAV